MTVVSSNVTQLCCWRSIFKCLVAICTSWSSWRSLWQTCKRRSQIQLLRARMPSMAGYSYSNSFDVRIKLNTDPNLTPNPIRTHNRAPNPNRRTSQKKTMRPVGVVKHANWIWDRRLQACGQCDQYFLCLLVTSIESPINHHFSRVFWFIVVSLSLMWTQKSA